MIAPGVETTVDVSETAAFSMQKIEPDASIITEDL